MAAEWSTVELGNVADLLTGFPFSSASYSTDPTAPRLLRGDNIAQGRLRWEGAKRWPKNATCDFEQYWLQRGDVILAMDRPWIEAGLKYAAVQASDLPALLVQRVVRMRGTKALEAAFLKYVIGSRDFTNYVLAIQTGTAVPHISGGQIKSFQFRLPRVDEQRAIAHILGTLDDKIELNWRMNETLEEMARALFKSWFVDFDPVLAKSEGRDVQLVSQTSDLFPNAFEQSAMGNIPIGWRDTVWGELVSLEYGKSLSGYSGNESIYPVFGTNGKIGTFNEPLCNHAGIIVGRKGAYRGIHFCSMPFFVIDTAFYVEPRGPMEMRWAYYELLRNDINSMDSG